ncbi:hydrolase [Streptomyces canus]|uniref:Hydrolase n=1 Tax=Streptomyces canus TaxID=58343 RepID=A0A101S7F6_9ACTN|nr:MULTISPECIES: HAD family acid phosphatase [Streptomyces]KUN68841.1 hydrolase [Streptomyces canus]MDI5911127.1 HAD family acid phosphatase [Streptomyces sp. 12257]
MTRIASRGRAAATVVATLVLGAAGATQAHAAPADQDRSAAVRAQSAAAAEVDYDTWQSDVRKVIDEARPYVQQRLANSAGQRPAIVLDIDNTSLETHFQLFPPTPAVKPTLELAQYAHSKGAAIFFVTARPDLIEFVTKANLQSVGYPVAGLYQRGLGDLFGDTAEFKTAKRAEIEGRGYTIIANIGNNTTDLVGGHAERTFKLPDYDGALD